MTNSNRISLNRPALVQEDLPEYVFSGGWGDGPSVLQCGSRIFLDYQEKGSIYYFSGLRRPRPRSIGEGIGGYFHAEDLPKVRDLQVGTLYLPYLVQEDRESGVYTVTGKDVRGKPFGLGFGPTFWEAQTRLRETVLEILGIYADRGKDPSEKLRESIPTKPQFILFEPQELEPIRQRLDKTVFRNFRKTKGGYGADNK